MKKTFQCEICGKEFGESEACENHEILCRFYGTPEKVKLGYIKNVRKLVDMSASISWSVHQEPLRTELMAILDDLRKYQVCVMWEGKYRNGG